MRGRPYDIQGDLTGGVDSIIDRVHRSPYHPPPLPPRDQEAPSFRPSKSGAGSQNGILLENSTIRIMTAISVVVLVIGLTWSGARYMSNIEARLDEIQATLSRQTDGQENRIKYILSEFCRRTERKNPSWQCPDPIVTSQVFDR